MAISPAIPVALTRHAAIHQAAVDIWREKLKCNKATKLSILGLVDDTHPTAAQLLYEVVMRDGFADQIEGNSNPRDES